VTATEKLALVLNDTLDLIRASVHFTEPDVAEGILGDLAAIENLVSDRAGVVPLLGALVSMLRRIRTAAERDQDASAAVLRHREDILVRLRDRLANRQAARGR